MNSFQILLNSVDRPGRALEAAAQRPRSWWLPAVLLAISMVVLTWFSAPYGVELANERTTQMIERITANMPDEQARMVRERNSEMTLSRYLLTTAGIGLAIAAIAWVVRGTIMHFSSMAAGGTSTWGPTFAVGVWSMLPFFFRDVVQTVYVLVTNEMIEHQGISFLVASGDWLKDSRNVLYALAANVDPFALWHLVLLSIGIAVATKISRVKGAVMAVGLRQSRSMPSRCSVSCTDAS